MAGWFITPASASRSLTALISRRPALTKRQMAEQTQSQHPNARLTCFSEVVAGAGSLQATMQRTRALPFRYGLSCSGCRSSVMCALP